MKDIDRFKGFAKKSKGPVFNKTNKAVIYTRVSTKEQADTNGSLDTQKKHCELYAKKNNFEIIEFFGGKNESAKTDDRKEFNKMLQFLKRRKDISHVIFFSYDRFSRSGANSLSILEQLKAQGIQTHSVTQTVDSTSNSGKLQEQFYMMFSEFDNNLRKEKSVAGMKEKLLKGYWIGTVPFGFVNLNPGKGKIQDIVPTKEGKLLKYAFEWKAKEQLSNKAISERLSKKGLIVNHKKLSDYFRNPFYCGIITSSHIPGQAIIGKHKPIVTQKLFLEVQKIIGNGYGVNDNSESENLPLKGFVSSVGYNSLLTGYIVKRKGLWYYKTNIVGAKENISAKKLHLKFLQLLNQYQIESKFKAPLLEAIFNHFKETQEDSLNVVKLLKQKIGELEGKLDRLEVRFVEEEEITKVQYDKYKSKIEADINKLSNELENSSFDLSNLRKAIEFVIQKTSKLNDIWTSGTLSTKRQLQKMVFPDGLGYDFEKGLYRTFRTNTIFNVTCSFRECINETKNGNKSKFSISSRSVQGNRQISNFIMQDVDVILHHAKLVGVAI